MNDLLLQTCRVGFGIMLAAAAFGPSAQAELVTYKFTGTIDVLNDPNNPLLGGQVRQGDGFSGTLVYDTSTATFVGSTPDFASYAYQNLGTTRNFITPIGITAQVGSYSITPDYNRGRLHAAVLNDATTTSSGIADGIEFQQDEQIGDKSVFYSLFLGDLNAKALSSTALPTSLTTSNFTDGTFTMFNSVASSSSPIILFRGTINGLQQVVPEPSSLTLCGLAIPALLVLRRRFAA